ncbi:hypothetical protein H9L17_04935 [Thermomonas brevis]|uniref:Uncharacterized protein n=1 Tax=Thermomonas brevis TaxID=215691 RepID=A0A7G9QVW1_9GAMM|nr:hypothetical protein [Thermomonas brevis]QNN47486.1 hypothetical protein H9L17_04935 [Thermomonas brevis]
MPHFKVILSGQEIELLFDGTPVVEFFTTRLVRAADLAAAERQAKDLVLLEWQSGDIYGTTNRGSIPALKVEDSFPVSFLAGTFGRKPSSYTFYRHED